MSVRDEIVNRLKVCDTVADYMTPDEMVEYCRSEYPGDYNKLIKESKK